MTRARLALNGLDAEVKQADAEALPFEDESFDVVLSSGVLHHTADTEQAIEEGPPTIETWWPFAAHALPP